MKISRSAFLLALGLLAFPATFLDARSALPAAGQEAVATDKAPAIVFILRHAEKPVGEDKSSDLTPVGFKRAAAIPSLFVQQAGSTQKPRLPRPDVLFATAVSKHSNRPIETITPLSAALHLPIHHDYEDRETAEIAKEVMSGKYAGKVVLICWHHGEIPHLTQAFGIASPPIWQDTVFDQIWEIQWVDGKAQLTTIPQQLLPGDATN
jgi:hypothetical protein